MTTGHDPTLQRIRRQLNIIKWMMAITIALTLAVFCKPIIFAAPNH